MKIFIFILLFTSWAQAQRIISLDPAATELLFALGLGKQVVAVAKSSNFPPASDTITKIETYPQPNRERILALRPDWIVGHRLGFEADIQDLKSPTIHVLLLDHKLLADYPKNLRSLQQTFRIEEKIIADLLASWEQAWLEIPVPFQSFRILVLAGHSPFMGVGSGTFIDEIIERCGHENILAEQKLYPRLGREFLTSKDIDIVLALEGPDSPRRAWKKSWLKIKRQKTLRFFQGDLLARLGPRLAPSAKSFCESLY